jgi:general secretion pathway protein G
MQLLKSSRTLTRSRSGFSLAELMVVIVILGLLATLVSTNVIKSLFTSNVSIAKADISAISQAIDNYCIDHGGKAPERLEELITPDESGHGYLDRTTVPKDPWKNEYVYEPPQAGQKFKVISYGRDGQPGGEGQDADIDNISMIERK